MRVCRTRLAVAALSLVMALFLLATKTTRQWALAQRSDTVADRLAQRRNTTDVLCENPRATAILTASALRAPSENVGYQQLSLDTQLTSHLIVDDIHKAIYCYVPKVACTNWKRVMMILAGSTLETDPLRIPSDSVHRDNIFTKLNSYKPDEVVRRLKTYKKFLFVRNPLERLLSAFRNKFEKNYASSAYFKSRFGVKIQKLFRRGAGAVPVSPTGNGTTFGEFVQYLVTTGQRGDVFNEHWAPMVDLCQPCLVRYDIIGKYESLSNDSAAVLSAIGAPEGLELPVVKPSQTAGFLNQYLNRLSPEQRENLQKLYAEDILLFGYTFREEPTVLDN